MSSPGTGTSRERPAHQSRPPSREPAPSPRALLLARASGAFREITDGRAYALAVSEHPVLDESDRARPRDPAATRGRSLTTSPRFRAISSTRESPRDPLEGCASSPPIEPESRRGATSHPKGRNGAQRSGGARAATLTGAHRRLLAWTRGGLRRRGASRARGRSRAASMAEARAGGRSRCAPSLVDSRPASERNAVHYVQPDEGSLARLAREAMQDVTERRRRSLSSWSR